MKKHYLILCLFLGFFGISRAQITVTQNDMPHPGDSTRLTKAQLNLFLNYAATGANHTWDFSNLRTNTQQLDSPMAVSATNFIYGLYYINLPFNSNRATVAYKNAGLAINPLIPATNPRGFYYLNSNKYEQVGIGVDLLNFPTPIAFNNHDVIYKLPLNFGDKDTSHSNWGFGLNGFAYAGYDQTRINHVDGWGSLITPHGTFNVLRVKTTRAQKDTISIDSLNLNLGLNRPLVTEYKWLANGETTPVLQINTQTIFGLEVITEILFIDDFLRIETNALASNVICAGSTITVPYTKFGTFNGSGLFMQGNKFTAQLSDASGSFANPINIGTVTSKLSGNITATIPPAILPGNHYRIRVISSDPVITGTDNGSDITIEYPVVTNINASGALSFCQPGNVQLLADSGTGYTYQWHLNNNVIPGATGSNYLASQSGDYFVAVGNSCGVVNTSSLTVAANPLPAVQLNSNAAEVLCPGSTLGINCTVTDATSMQWQLNGNDLTGETTDQIIINQTGVYTLIVVNNCGTATSSPVTVTQGLLPTVSVSALNLILCPGSAVQLSSSSTDATSYQWQLNGSDLPGETNTALNATQAGDYTLVAINSCGSVASLPVTITAGSLPTASISGAPSTLCTGNSALLTAVAPNALSYQWQLNGLDIPGETNPTTTILQGGTYTLIVSNDCGSVISAAVNVAQGLLPTVSLTGIPQTLCAGDSALLTSVSTDALTYQWQLNGNDITGAIGPVYYANASGSYTLTVSNNCGNVSSNVMNVTVNPLPPLPNITLSTDTLYASGTGLFQWYYNGTAIPGATAAYYVPLQNGTYTVMVTDANGCTRLSDDFTVVNVGVAENSNDSFINIYPNPVKDFLYINNSGSHKIREINIFNNLGQLIIGFPVTEAGSLVQINTSNLTPGYYIIQIQKNNTISNYQLIKN